MYVRKDNQGKIISGAFANYQEGIAEHFITEEEWEAFQASQTKDLKLPETPTQKLFRVIREQPNFPWQKFYDSAKISVEAQAVFTLLFTGLTSSLSLDFIASRFKEMLEIMEKDSNLPKLTAVERKTFKKVLQECGIDTSLFFN